MFLNYDYVSVDGLDELVIQLRTNDAFLSQTESKQLFYTGYEIREKLRKQLPPPSAALAKEAGIVK